MSIELAEKLKEKLTDKYVVVDGAVPELRRFAEWTGRVKTVNMNCRALVEFDGPVDIGWYDIDPAFLTIVDGPKKKAVAEEKVAATKTAPAASPAPKLAASSGGKSPLDAIRAAGAAKPAGAASPPAGAKPSPLDLIRKQQAAKQAGATPSAGETQAVVSAPEAKVETAVASSPSVPAPTAAGKAPLPTTGPDGKPLSKLDLIRMQGAKKPS